MSKVHGKDLDPMYHAHLCSKPQYNTVELLYYKHLVLQMLHFAISLFWIQKYSLQCSSGIKQQELKKPFNQLSKQENGIHAVNKYWTKTMLPTQKQYLVTIIIAQKQWFKSRLLAVSENWLKVKLYFGNIFYVKDRELKKQKNKNPSWLFVKTRNWLTSNEVQPQHNELPWFSLPKELVLKHKS